MRVTGLETQRLQPLLPLVRCFVTIELLRTPLGTTVGHIEVPTIPAELAFAAQVLQGLVVTFCGLLVQVHRLFFRQAVLHRCLLCRVRGIRRDAAEKRRRDHGQQNRLQTRLSHYYTAFKKGNTPVCVRHKPFHVILTENTVA